MKHEPTTLLFLSCIARETLSNILENYVGVDQPDARQAFERAARHLDKAINRLDPKKPTGGDEDATTRIPEKAGEVH